MKVGVILYHSDIEKIYKKNWIEKCLESIKNQTFYEFIVYELCYSKDRFQWWSGSQFSHIQMPNHIFAMNHILDKAFLDECDVVMNINMDDIYHSKRFELQLKAIKEGYELISNDFKHIEELNGQDTFIRNMIFHDRDIKKELDLSHNIICHSSVAYTKKFWLENRYYKTNELGYEDLSLWKKAINKSAKFYIVPQCLCEYRLSEKQTGRLWNAQGIKIS